MAVVCPGLSASHDFRHPLCGSWNVSLEDKGDYCISTQYMLTVVINAFIFVVIFGKWGSITCFSYDRGRTAMWTDYKAYHLLTTWFSLPRWIIGPGLALLSAIQSYPVWTPNTITCCLPKSKMLCFLPLPYILKTFALFFGNSAAVRTWGSRKKVIISENKLLRVV